MNNSMIGTAAGASSPSKLAPETIRIRNALIEKYADQPIEELNNFLQRALEAEKDELKRLGLLAARVYILRQKVLSLKAFIRDERMDKIPTPNLALTEQILLDETAHSDIDANNETVDSSEWHSLQMIEPGEVNGVRIFQGTVINAKAEDAEKLISSGKAIVIDDQGKPVEGNANDSEDNTDNDNIADPTANVIDKTVAVEGTDDGIALDDKNGDNPNAMEDSDSTNNDNTADPNAEVIDETAAVEATDDNIALDDRSVEDPNAPDGAVRSDGTDNDHAAAETNANVIDEAVAVEAADDGIESDDKNAEDANVEDAIEDVIEDASEESTKNRDVDGSEKIKV